MTESALYRFYGAADVLLYVGLSQCPFIRSKAHEARAPWYRDVRFMEVEWHASREDAARAETVAIDRERPLYNAMGAHKARQVAETPKAAMRAVERPSPPEIGPVAPWTRYAVGSEEYAARVGAHHRFYPLTPEKIDLASRVAREGDVLFIEGEGAVYVLSLIHI